MALETSIRTIGVAVCSLVADASLPTNAKAPLLMSTVVVPQRPVGEAPMSRRPLWELKLR